MQKNHLFSVLATAGTLSAALLTGCVDDNYDLENIDTTMKFEVNDLVLPLNLAPVTLSDLIDLSDEEGIEVIDGEYVLIKEGTFSGDSIKIESIKTDPKGTTDPNFDTTFPELEQGVAVPLPDYLYKFSYNYEEVEKYIVSLIRCKVDLTLSLSITTKYANGTKAIDCDLPDLKLVLPKGFFGTLSNGMTIDANSSNIVSIPNASTGANGVFKIDFHVTEFDFEASGATLEDRVFALDAEMGVYSGKLVAKSPCTAPVNLGYFVQDSSIDIKEFSGTVYYDVEDLNTNADISLSDLPDVLTNDSTQISLRNPQLYISIVNPLGNLQVHASSGLKISQVRPEGQAIQTAEVDGRIIIAGVEGEQTYCLLPDPSDKNFKLYDKYPTAKLYKFNNFENIIYGLGLPQSLKVDFETPMLDQQTVHDFPLGKDLGVIGGSYTLYAPLELGANSLIYYEDEATGWGLSSDGNELNVRLLTIEADVTSNLPIGVDLVATPLNTEGQSINNVVVSPVHIPANDSEHIVIKMSGTIKDLDGMRYTAKIRSVQDAKALSPDSQLKLDNIKITVSGNYLLKDDDKD